MKCTLNDVEVNYHIHGEGNPILLVHGFCIDHQSLALPMKPLIERQGNWKQIYLDLPGMGDSPAHPSIKNSDDMLKLVSTFIDYVIPDQCYTLFGYSYGGYLSQGLTYQRPGRIQGLGLMCPVIISPLSDRTLPQETCFVRDDEFLDAIPFDKREEFETNTVVQTRTVWERTQAEIQSGLDKIDIPFCDSLNLRDNYQLSFPVCPLPTPFEKPSLILTGRQDNIVGYADQIALVESYPRATHATLDRAGHHLQIEQDKLFDALVTEWLDRVVEVNAL